MRPQKAFNQGGNSCERVGGAFQEVKRSDLGADILDFA